MQNIYGKKASYNEDFDDCLSNKVKKIKKSNKSLDFSTDYTNFTNLNKKLNKKANKMRPLEANVYEPVSMNYADLYLKPAFSTNNKNNDTILPITEKNRLISINEAFEILRSNIPTFPYERRLSKIDTLHLAISYINLLESVIQSNMNLFDYLKTSICSSFSSNNQLVYQSSKLCAKPIWATSDLTVRLNWLNWNALGVDENEIQSFLSLFQMFGDLNKEKLLKNV